MLLNPSNNYRSISLLQNNKRYFTNVVTNQQESKLEEQIFPEESDMNIQNNLNLD